MTIINTKKLENAITNIEKEISKHVNTPQEFDVIIRTIIQRRQKQYAEVSRNDAMMNMPFKSLFKRFQKDMNRGETE